MAGEPVCELFSIYEIIRRCRMYHKVDMGEDLTLIEDVKNNPISATPDASELDNWISDEAQQILDAVKDYSQDMPLHQVLLVQANGSRSFFLDSLVTGWKNRDYKIERIQYPIDGQYEQQWLDSAAFRQTTDPATNRPLLQFQNNLLSGQMAIHYFRPHVFEPGLNQMSIFDDHWEAVAKKAAAKVLRIAAARCAGFGDRIGGFDSKSLADVMQRYETKADKYDEEYAKILDTDQPDAAPTFVRWESTAPSGYRSYHPDNLY